MKTLLAIALVLGLTACSDASKKAPEAAAAKPAGPVVVPEKYRVRLKTTAGDIVLQVERAWAPRGADRFHELVRTGFYDGARFYRVRKEFIAQFGISASPKSNELWRQLKFMDDPVKQSNKRGFVAFASDGKNSRTTQVFLNLTDNSKKLDKSGFAPFAEVVEGMDVADKLYYGYGEVQALGGGGPDTAKLETLGEQYAERSYPRLDRILTAKIE